MATITSWGSKKNGCRVGIQYSDTNFEYTSDGSQARIGSFTFRFSSDDPIWDTSNTLSCSGAAVVDGSWSNEFSKSSNWSGTMNLKSQTGQYVTLAYGATESATCSVSLSGISYAGGTLTDSVTVSYPARAYSVPMTPNTPYFNSVSESNAVIYWYCNGTTLAGAQPFASTSLYIYRHSDGAAWVTNAQGWSGNGGVTFGFNQTGVAPSTQYSFFATASNSSGTSGQSGWVSLWTTPIAPSNTSATRYSDTYIDVFWTNNHYGQASAAQNYVYVSENDGGWAHFATVAGTATSTTYTGGKVNCYYRFATNSQNITGWGYGPATGYVLNTITPPVVTVGTLSVTTPHGTAYDTAKQTSQAMVSWTHASPTFVQSYDVYLNGVLFGSTASTSMLVTGFLPAQNNTISVVAKRTIAPVGASAAATVSGIVAPNVTVAPSTPSFGSFSASGGVANVVLSWPAVSGATGYYVDKVLTEGEVSGDTYVEASRVSLTNMSPGKSYQFTVYALNQVGYSLGTSSPVITTPTVPGSPQSVYVAYVAGTLSMSWTPPASNGGVAVIGYQYKIERQDVVNGPWIEDVAWTILGNVLALSMEKPTAINYRVSVRALNGSGYGSETYAETGLIGGYIRVYDGSDWQDVFLKLNVSGSYTRSAIVRIYDGTDWVPLTYV